MNCKDFINFNLEKISKKFDNNFDIGKNKLILLLKKLIKIENIIKIYNYDLNEDEIKILNYNIDQMVIFDKPIEYIIEEIDFINIKIKVKEPILIPRVETEYWVNEVIKDLEKIKENKLYILDLFCGSGCIGLSFINEFKNSECLALDIDENACLLSKKNSILNNLENRYKVLNEDFFNFLNKKIDKKFDILFANPPYISINEYDLLDSSVKNWESLIALTDRENGMLFIENLIDNIKDLVKKNGFVFIEFGSNQKNEIINFIKNKKIDLRIEFFKDQYNNDRYLKIFL